LIEDTPELFGFDKSKVAKFGRMGFLLVMSHQRVLLLAFLPFLLLGCSTIKTEHHITLDHNITIKVEKEVNDFLDDLYGE
tara:strand:- start:189 stop:428 length:240 start_codon:yes stop_codon:yes gene_type:complete